MSSGIRLLLVLLAVAGAALGAGAAAANGPAELPPGFQKAVVVSGLVAPTAFAFTPDNRIIIAQKGGTVRIWKQGQLLPTPFITIPVSSDSERGVLGVAVDPGFATNRHVYFYYTTRGPDPENRVSRFTAVGDVADPASEVVLLDGIPSDAGNHNAGCVRFGLDGKLYISTGDGGAFPQQAQDLGSLAGKILRINPDGSVPPDNPFVGTPGARPEIWAYGFRNPFRFGIQPRTGLPFVGDVGSTGLQGTEEINIVQKGGNYGWPNQEGPGGEPEYIDPLYWYGTAPSAAIIGGAFYEGTRFPFPYNRGYYFGDWVRGWIRVLFVDQNNELIGVRDFDPNAPGAVDFAVRFGALFYLNYAGSLNVIFYRGG